MVFITTTQSGNFECDLLKQVMTAVHPFFMARLKHKEEKFGRVMQGVVIESPPDLPVASEVLWMPEMRVR